MLSLPRRALLTGILAAMFFAIAPQFRSAQAQTGNIEYVEDLGGWLDWDTGLVWGEHSYFWSHSSWTWNGVETIYLPRYRTATGIANWRMPTVAESQTAAEHGIAEVLIDLVNFPLFGGYGCWTSDTAKIKGVKGAYTVAPLTGRVNFYALGSGNSFIPVYRAFTP